MIKGSAVLTSQSGTIEVVDDSGRNHPIEPRVSLDPVGMQWTTGNNAHAFLAFSNGTALGIGKSTHLRIPDFMQRPFGPETEGFSYEPSTSKLTVELVSGELALVAQRVSPVSEFRVHLPYGSLRVHRGIAHIQYNETGLYLAMIEGNSTYYYPGDTAREFVSAGALIRISDQSAQRQQVADRLSIDALSAEAVRLHQAATHASRRVLFQANTETGAPPEPLMIVSPDYYEQPSPRPYEFNE